MATRGRPPSKAGALTPAQRKAAQRKRDREALFAGGDIAELTTSALLEPLPALIADDRSATLGQVLKEIGRRGGLIITCMPSPLGREGRIL